MERISNTRLEHTIKCFLAIFEQVFFKMLLPVYCVNEFIFLFICLFVCLLFLVLSDLCTEKWLSGHCLRATIKSRSCHYLCNSNDWFNYSSFVCLFVCVYVCFIFFEMLMWMQSFCVFENARLVGCDPLVFAFFTYFFLFLLLLLRGSYVHGLIAQILIIVFIFTILLWTLMRWITNAILCIVFCAIDH